MSCTATASCNFAPVERGLCRTHLRLVAATSPPALSPKHPRVEGEAALVASVEGLIHREVRRAIWRLQSPALTYEDLLAEGRLGALIAARRFDPARGFKFMTYASHWIQHNVRRAVQDHGRTIRVPSRLQVGRPMPSDLATEKTANQISRLGAYGMVYLDDPLYVDDRRKIMDSIAAPEAEDDAFAEARAPLREVLPHLEARERAIVEGRLAGKTLREIGEQLSLSRERVRQLEARVFESVRRLARRGSESGRRRR